MIFARSIESQPLRAWMPMQGFYPTFPRSAERQNPFRPIPIPVIHASTPCCVVPGDIAACYGADPLSRLISLATWSPLPPWFGPSHVAFITEFHPDGPLWVESTTFCPRRCAVNGTVHAGAQAHDPRARIRDYCEAGGRVEIYSPTDLRQYTDDELDRIREVLIGRFVLNRIRYDLRGAVISGTRLLRFLPGDDVERLFCSELIAALLASLGRLNNGVAGRYSPHRLIRELVRTGVYEFSHAYGPGPGVLR